MQNNSQQELAKPQHTEYTSQEDPLSQDPDAMAAYQNSIMIEQSSANQEKFDMNEFLAKKAKSNINFLKTISILKVIELKDKSIYEGELQNNKLHGKGVHNSPDGSGYEGEFFEGKYHGFGKRFFNNGQLYEGQFKNGLMEGKGQFKWTNGTIYNGDFKGNLLNGKGSIIYLTGDEYEGDFKNGVKHGKGVFKYKSGAVYEGELKNGSRWGKGVLYNKKTGYRAEGDFKDIGLHGKGTMITRSGFTCTGDFKQNLLHGNGETIHKWGLKTVAEYSSFLPHGRGTQEFLGEKYDGTFSCGNKQGDGVRTYSNGDVYTGLFNFNYKCGEGVYTFHNGGYYQGEFFNDSYHGYGKLTTKEGGAYEGYWLKGKPMGEDLLKKLQEAGVKLIDYYPLPTVLSCNIFTRVDAIDLECKPEISQTPASNFWEAFCQCIYIFMRQRDGKGKHQVKTHAEVVKKHSSYLIQKQLDREFDENSVSQLFDQIDNEKEWNSFQILEPICRVYELEIFAVKISGKGQINTEIVNQEKSQKRFYLALDTRNGQTKFDAIKTDPLIAFGCCFKSSDKEFQTQVIQLAHDISEN